MGRQLPDLSGGILAFDERAMFCEAGGNGPAKFPDEVDQVDHFNSEDASLDPHEEVVRLAQASRQLALA